MFMVYFLNFVMQISFAVLTLLVTLVAFLNILSQKKAPYVSGAMLFHLKGIIYNIVDGQTYSDFGTLVFAISVNPPITSEKLSQPLCLSIEAAIMLR